MNGPFAVQEYLQELISKFSQIFKYVGNNPSNIQKIVEPPKEVDENVWQYEHIR
jgi:hypothetical protein